MAPANGLRVRFRVMCVNPPGGSWGGRAAVFGLQDQHQKLKMGASVADDSLEFTADVRARTAGENADYSGAFVHGRPGERFLYLSLAYAEDRSAGWIQRIKVPLPALAWDEIERLAASGQVVAATIDGQKAARANFLKPWAAE